MLTQHYFIFVLNVNNRQWRDPGHELTGLDLFLASIVIGVHLDIVHS